MAYLTIVFFCKIFVQSVRPDATVVQVPLPFAEPKRGYNFACK